MQARATTWCCAVVLVSASVALPARRVVAEAARPAPVSDPLPEVSEAPPAADAPHEAAAPVIVPRTTWDPDGAPDGLRYPGRAREALTHVVVHHSDFLEPPGPTGIKQYHLEVSGFSDIGYHFVIDADGTIYEGRPLDRMGAHAGATREGTRGDKRHDPDWGAVGIVIDGYFGDAPPKKPQLDALVALVRHLKRELPRVHDVIAHREVRARVLARGDHPTSDLTVCPGDALAAWLDAARALDLFAPLVP